MNIKQYLVMRKKDLKYKRDSLLCGTSRYTLDMCIEELDQALAFAVQEQEDE